MSDTPVENHPCAACGQLDDHPMIHVGPAVWEKDAETLVRNPSFHFDCLPPEFEEQVADGDQHANTRATIAAARKGIHGAKLAALIAKQPSDNEVSA